LYNFQIFCIIETMKTIQITMDESLLAEVDKVGEPAGLELSRIIEDALKHWLKRYQSKRFGQEWIAALKKNPDDAGRAEAWLETQAWSEQ